MLINFYSRLFILKYYLNLERYCQLGQCHFLKNFEEFHLVFVGYTYRMRTTWICVIGLGLLSGLCAAAKDEDEDKAKKNDKENVGTVIGIDLGTTYSWYGIVEDNFCDI